MILATLVAASLSASLATSPAGPQLLSISIDRAMPLTTIAPGSGRTMPVEQKDAALRPLVTSATDCIARTVSADPRFRSAAPGARFNDLIVDSVPSCRDALRSMIDAYDRFYGDGTGETFFMGPYLDSLPEAVSSRVKNGR